MSEIRFYHLQQQSLEQALPLLLRKALEGGKRILVRLENEDQMSPLSDAIWGYKDEGFIPHGVAGEGHEADQPILLTANNDNTNKADMLLLVNGADDAEIDKFDLCCVMFNGADQDTLTSARARWKSYKDTDHELSYWQQTPQGGWEKKA